MGVILASEKMPTAGGLAAARLIPLRGLEYLRHLRPDTSWFFSSSLLKAVLEATAATRSCSLADAAPMICLVASFQGVACFR